MKKLSFLLGAALSVVTLVGCGIIRNMGGLGGHSYSFSSLPNTVEQMEALPEARLTDPYAVAALTVAALARYESSPSDCFAMLNFLKGPEPLSSLEKQQIRERLGGKTYKARSFFAGATPDNNYTPTQPYKVVVTDNSYSYQSEGWATLYLKSGGADSPRPVKLRKKPSTGQWFLNDIQFLADIRLPAAEDKWR